MPLVNAYATLEEVKKELEITNETEDAQLERAINAASRTIDGYCHTRFYTVVDEVRTFTAQFSNDVWIDQCVAITAVAVDADRDRTYSTVFTDFEHGSTPFTHLYKAPNSSISFPTGRHGVQITGEWGYSRAADVPPNVTAACVLMAAKIYKSKDAVFGVQSTAGIGQIVNTYPKMVSDPRIVSLLSGYVYCEVI